MKDEEPPARPMHIADVRQMLLDQMRALRSASRRTLPLEIRRARGVAELGAVLVASARAEVEYIHAVRGASESPFLQNPDEAPSPQIPTKPQSALPAPDDPARLGGPAESHPWRGSITRHRLKG